MALFKKNKKKEAKEKPQKKPLEIWYDANDVRIGDDGYPMTPIRQRMHTIWNAFFIYAIVLLVWGCACMVLAYFTGETFVDWELIATGGHTVNGIQLGTVMRIEALVCLWSAVAMVVLNFKGFAWLYDKQESAFFKGLLYGLGIVSVIMEIAFLALPHLLSPACFVNIFFIVFAIITMKKVKEERPTLKKAKKVRKEVK